MQPTINELDRAHHVHPFTNIKEIKDEGVMVVEKAEGVYVYDETGKRYIDGMAGLWCVNLGYGRQELAAAAQQQMATLPYYNTFFKSTTAPAAKLAAKLTELTPENINHVFFANSGSEANDTIVRMARTYWDTVGQPSKRIFISRWNSYHGSTMAGTSLTGLESMHGILDLPLPGFHHIPNPYPFRDGRLDDLEAYGREMAGKLEEKIIELGAENVAAFHADPIAAGGGVLVPPDSYWPEIMRICQKYDVLLSIDEVICGFGRTGAWLATEVYDLKPDFIAIAKGLSSGYVPISAALVSDRIIDVLSQREGGFQHGFTYSGHPVSAAVALENIRIMEEEGIIERVAKETGPYFEERMNALRDHPLVGEVRVKGMIAGVEMVADKATLQRFDPPGKAGKLCFSHCMAQGLITRPYTDSMAFSPPIVMTKGEIDELVALFRHCLDLTAADLVA